MRFQNLRAQIACASSILTLAILVLVISLLSSAQEKPRSGRQTASAHNTLTRAEKAAGWKLLFDGKTWNGWRGFRRDKVPDQGWVIEDGTIKHLAGKGEQSQQGGDLITVGKYDNFEFQLEWRVSRGANSGVKYLIDEDMVKSGYSGLGFEMQILDDDAHPDAKAGKNGNRTASALYDLIAPTNKKLNPVGEWNQIRLIIQGNHVEHWLNGAKVVEFELGSPQLKALIAESKYKNIPRFGEVRKGHILLQDHGSEVWFRNIKIREFPVLVGGVVGGVAGGIRTGSQRPPPPPPPPPPTQGEPPKIIRKSGGVLQQSAIRRVEPVYPPLAKAAEVSGAVVVEITVDEQRDVISARAISGHPLLKDAAVDAARGWKFSPMTLGGVPVKVIGTITFNFSL